MIETKSAYISLVEEDIIKVVFKPHAFLTDEEYSGYMAHYEQLAGKRGEYKFLCIVQVGFKVENRYLKFLTKSYKTNFKKAEAYVIKNPSAKMFFNLGTKIVKRKYPILMFDSEEEALTWLRSID